MLLIKQTLLKNLRNIYPTEQARNLPRWATRIPKKVFVPEALKDTIQENEPDIVNINKEHVSFPGSGTTKSFKKSKHLKPATIKQKPKEPVDMLETTFDADGNIIYTKMKNKDTRISQILSDVKSHRSKKHNSILLEGKRLIKEALRSGCKLKYVLFSRKDDVQDLISDLPKFGSHLYKMPYNEMQNWSDLTTNPGIMGIFEIPESKKIPDYSIPVTVICDNVREPGNLGAILRVCAAAGCKKVILTKGCCDPWNTKVLRSAMGAHFKINIEKVDWEKIGANYQNSRILVADSNLNTNTKIPTNNYSSINFNSFDDILLIVGGETEGVSEDAYNFAQSGNGECVHVPLSNNIDSLNSGVALGILVFEIKRQLG